MRRSAVKWIFVRRKCEFRRFAGCKSRNSHAANGEKDVDVKIGSENPYKQLTKSSVIVSNYNIDGNRRGSIGIIGPTRIDYEKLIPSVKYLTDLVGKLLTQTFKDE